VELISSRRNITVRQCRLSRSINRFSCFQSSWEAGTPFRLNALWKTQYAQTCPSFRETIFKTESRISSKTPTKSHHRHSEFFTEVHRPTSLARAPAGPHFLDAQYEKWAAPFPSLHPFPFLVSETETKVTKARFWTRYCLTMTKMVS